MTVADAIRRDRPWRECRVRRGADLGAFAGVAMAQAMFGSRCSRSPQGRAGLPQVFAETVATFGLLAVIFPRGADR